jgi:uncharacterized protein involved in type VI secretion and phage assembly
MTNDSSQPEQYWTLRGYDTFDRHDYHIPGRYGSEAEAIEAARIRLVKIERDQPRETSAGPWPDGIQDSLSIIAPDGTGRLFRG